MINTITYFSQNATPSEAWMAYALLPNGKRWNVYATGSTEAEAVGKIVSLYESERAKVKPVDPWSALAKPLIDAIPEKYATGRGSHFVGKSWLINKATREKIRVPTGDVNKYLETGEWEKGGPRSK